MAKSVSDIISKKKPNPLLDFIRKPKIYTKLPSNNKFYKFNTTLTDEIPVKAMTAKDEILLKSPDALLNGSAIENMITSCCPEIKNPKILVLPDIDVILLAIRYASYGDKLEYNIQCPHCGNHNHFEHSIRMLLDEIILIPDDNYVSIINDNIKIDIYIRPYTYEDSIKANLMTYEQARMVDMISKSQNLNEELQRKQINEAFEKLNDFTYETTLDTCYQINITQKDNNDNDIINTITDKSFISEFFLEIDKKTYDSISEKLLYLNKKGIKKDFEAKCENQECLETYPATIGFDPTDFFDKNS